MKRFTPGRSLCSLDRGVVATALDGLEAPHAAIRRRAVIVLSNAPMTAVERERYEAALGRLGREDLDPGITA